MAFNFGAQPLTIQDPTGVDLSGVLAQLQAGAGQSVLQDANAAPSQQAPASPAAPRPQDIQVSPLEATLAWLAHGGTPAEAAQNVRATKLKNMMDSYALQQAQMRMQALQQAQGPLRTGLLFNPDKTVEEYAKNLAPVSTPGGDTQTMYGGPAAGGYSFMAPKVGVTDAGVPYALSQQGSQILGPQFAGQKSAENGLVLDKNLGPVGAYSTPHDAAPGTTVYPFTPQFSGPGVSAPGAGAAGAPSAQPAPAAAGKPLDGASFFQSFVLPHEGGLNPHDMNGAPTNFGINQSANPGVDVSKLTPAQAQEIFVKKYWQPSGAANMPAPLAAVHADTYFINPKMAQSFLQQSGGDPNAYLGLRAAWMQNLVASNPKAAPYANAWAKRNADLQSFIAQNGGGQTQGAQGAPSGGFGAPLVQGQAVRAATPAELKAHGLAPDASANVKPNGELDVIDPGLNDERLISLRGQLADKEPIKNYQMAKDAYGAMLNAASQPNGGMRAYALRDTFARAINPGAVARSGTIEAIKSAQGIPANVQAYFLNLRGDGDVPPQIAQQILDVTRGFVASHYANAQALNQSYGHFVAKRRGDPADVEIDLGDAPQRMVLGQVPPPQQRASAIYATPKGPLFWTGTGWRKIN